MYMYMYMYTYTHYYNRAETRIAESTKSKYKPNSA